MSKIKIIASQRSDGTWRKEVKIKPGYRPPEEVPVYKAPFKKVIISTENVRGKIIKVKVLWMLYRNILVETDFLSRQNNKKVVNKWWTGLSKNIKTKSNNSCGI